MSDKRKKIILIDACIVAKIQNARFFSNLIVLRNNEKNNNAQILTDLNRSILNLKYVSINKANRIW